MPTRTSLPAAAVFAIASLLLAARIGRAEEKSPAAVAFVYGPKGPVGPREGVKPPEGATVVTPETRNLALLVAFLPPNVTLYFSAGEYTTIKFPITPKTGQVYMGDKGAVIVNRTTLPTFYSEAADVTITNLTLDGGGPEFPKGLVTAPHHWTITNCEIRNANAVAVMMFDRSVVRDCYIHRYGQTGVHGDGPNVEVTGCDIGIGNQAFKYPVNVEVGSVKFWGTTDALVESNSLHDNIGPGLWLDGTQRSTARFNRAYNNSRFGIQFEVSRTGTISENLCESNGYNSPGNPVSMRWLFGSGIFIETAYDVLVTKNVLKNNANGIGVVCEYRPEVSEAWQFRQDGVPFTGSVRITDNDVTMNKAGCRTGVVWDFEKNAPNPFANGNIVFSGNKYTLGSVSGFVWNSDRSTSVNPLSMGQWKALGNQ